MIEQDVKQWLAIRKEAGLRLGSIRKPPRSIGTMRRHSTPMGFVPTFLRNYGKSDGNTSLDLPEVTSGSTSMTCPRRRATSLWRRLRAGLTVPIDDFDFLFE
jgi:hypothetical protein